MKILPEKPFKLFTRSSIIPAAQTWNSESIFFSGDQYFDSITKDILAAHKSINIETYKFEWDEMGKKLIDNLLEASNRNVRVRILVDAVGSINSIDKLKDKLKNSNIELRIYNPILWKTFFRSITHINQRNHRKIFLFDNITAYVGSMNISASHLLTISGKDVWRDMGLRVQGSEVSILNLAFNKAWRKDTILNFDIHSHWENYFKIKKSPLVQVNNSLLKRKKMYKSLIYRIHNSKNQIWLASAYFSPKFLLTKELCAAAQRGVDVRIILPKNSDVFFTTWLTSNYYYSLLQAGVKIYEYIPSMYHAKVVYIDNWIILGSSNLNHRSLLHDLEVALQVTMMTNKENLKAELLKDFEHSQLITFSSFKARSWLNWFLSKLFLLFKYWV